MMYCVDLMFMFLLVSLEKNLLYKLGCIEMDQNSLNHSLSDSELRLYDSLSLSVVRTVLWNRPLSLQVVESSHVQSLAWGPIAALGLILNSLQLVSQNILYVNKYLHDNG